MDLIGELSEKVVDIKSEHMHGGGKVVFLFSKLSTIGKEISVVGKRSGWTESILEVGSRQKV